MKITHDQVVAAEDVASDVYDEKITASNGSTTLAERHGVNINTARDFINDYRHMMEGRVFRRAMSAPAINYFLAMIREKRGSTAHALAISAVQKHIDYYEQIRNENLHALRAVVDGHRVQSNPVDLLAYLERFSEAVEESLKSGSSARAVRLSKAAKIPAKVAVLSYAFARNADVVAEVLLRADGKCERCTDEAPFKRKRDLKPYLEVHHVVQLSKGGEDTVANAQALCPNCHRQLHFG